MSRFLFMLVLIVGINYLLGGFRRRIFYPPARGAERSGPGTDSGDELVQDPVCMTYLSRKGALQAGREGVTHYFCSPECVKAFQKSRSQ
jgi:YHS domain-containing protein